MSAGIACALVHKSEFCAKLAFNEFADARYSFNSNSSQIIYFSYRKNFLY